MNIRVTQPYHEVRDWTLEVLVRSKVDGSDYGRGELETLRATVENQTVLLAKIIELINPTNEQLTEMLGGWHETLEKIE